MRGPGLRSGLPTSPKGYGEPGNMTSCPSVLGAILAFLPHSCSPAVAPRAEHSRKKGLSHSHEARWKLTEPMRILLEHFHGPFESAQQLAEHAKACRIPLQRPRPLEEAISSAGVFVAGEMMDWEAPTGGYLLQGCFATGTLAAEGALGFVGVR